jgi:hypothetical protein
VEDSKKPCSCISTFSTSLRNARTYIKSLTNIKKLPYWSVATNLSFVEDEQYPVVNFKFIQQLSIDSIADIQDSLDLFKDYVRFSWSQW